MTDLVGYKIIDGTAVITLDNPRAHNAIDATASQQLFLAIRQARLDDAHIVVLRANGPSFCVGGDIAAFAGADSTENLVDDLAELVHRCVNELTQLDAIVLAVVHGTTAGAGVPLVAAADLVLASESASFTLAYTRVGLTPDGGSSLLAATFGLHRTLHLALRNPRLTAQQAQNWGLVTETCPDGELDAVATRIVQDLRAGSRSAQVGAKHLIRRQALPAPESAMRQEALAIRRAAASPDAAEGFDAFLSKRPAKFPSSNAARRGPWHE